MRTIATMVVLGLFGCGGAEFQGLSGADAGEDAFGEASPLEDAPEASLVDGATDAATSVDAAAGDACTPLVSAQRMASAPCEANAVIAPDSYYSFVTGDGGAAGCLPNSTPAACRCAETFTCACLETHGGCRFGFAWLGCHEADGEAPTPTCGP